VKKKVTAYEKEVNNLFVKKKAIKNSGLVGVPSLQRKNRREFQDSAKHWPRRLKATRFRQKDELGGKSLKGVEKDALGNEMKTEPHATWLGNARGGRRY